MATKMLRRRPNVLQDHYFEDSDDSSDSSDSPRKSKTSRYRENIEKNDVKNASQKRKKSSENSTLSDNKRQKCFSRNALMARENRLKKKMYIQSLEDDVNRYKSEADELKSVVNNQMNIIKKLETETKYLKSIVVNSTEISKLLKTVKNNTNLPITTSLNLIESNDNNKNEIKFPKNYMSNKWSIPIAKKTGYPWNNINNDFSDSSESFNHILNSNTNQKDSFNNNFHDTNPISSIDFSLSLGNENLPTFQSDDDFMNDDLNFLGTSPISGGDLPLSVTGSDDFDEILNDLTTNICPSQQECRTISSNSITTDSCYTFDDNINDPTKKLDRDVATKSISTPYSVLTEHSYSFDDDIQFTDKFNSFDKSSINTDLTDDVGICLHVSKQKVSLEFCATCNTNAALAWNKEQ